MLPVAVSQSTTSRWELSDDLAHSSEHGFEAISVWRAKLSDCGIDRSARLISNAGMRVSSVHWAGGFTGSDGRSFNESVADALEALLAANDLAAPVLIVSSGCRGGHTLTHAHRLLRQALEAIAPAASRAGVTLAIKPIHAAAAVGSSFLTNLSQALELVEQFDDSSIKLSLDLWQFGHQPDLLDLLPRLAVSTAAVQVADRIGRPSFEQERLPAGEGSLPLEATVLALLEEGYAGPIEFDPVGEAVEEMGYEQTLASTRLLADRWADAWVEAQATTLAATARVHAYDAHGSLSRMWPDGQLQPWQIQLRSALPRRSHASSQIVSRG